MSYANRNYYKKGSWNAHCDVCGFKFKSDQMRKRWDGLMVCDQDWEPDHPQKYLRVKEDKQTVPWVRQLADDSAYTPPGDFNANPRSGYAPLLVRFEDLSYNAPQWWSWDFQNDGSEDSTLRNPSYTYVTVGTYSVKLVASNINGSTTTTKTGYITVLTPPAHAVIGASSTTGYAPLAITLQDLSYSDYTAPSTTGAPMTAWQWRYLNVTSVSPDSTAQNPTYTFVTPGTYSVNLVVTNSYGSTSSTTATNYITVVDPPMTAAFNPVLTHGNASLVINFTDLSSVNPTTWQWNFGDGVGTSTSKNPTYTYATVGLYHVTLTASNGYHTSSVSHDVFVDGPIPGSAVKLQLYANESSGVPIDKALTPNTVNIDADTTYKYQQQNTVAGPFDAYSSYINGGTSHTTANASNLTYGGCAYMTIPSSLKLDTGDFSVEFWYRLSSNDLLGNRGGWLINCDGYGSSYNNGGPPDGRNEGRWSVWIANDGTYTWYQGPKGATAGTHQALTGQAVSVDTWHFGCVERQGTTLRYWLDGVMLGETTQTTAPDSSAPSGVICIGGLWNQTTPRPTMGNYVGYFGGIRITTGYVRNGGSYTSKWPVPT